MWRERIVKKRLDWAVVWERLHQLAAIERLPNGNSLWRAGQDASLKWITRQLEAEPGVLIADEVGLGKTRLAIALAICVASCGGKVAILIPPGLTSQWCDDELRGFHEQLQTLDLGWLPTEFTTKVLRTYPDLFRNGKEACAYPLSSHAQFVFLSHRFGLPQRLPSVKRDELWGLPFAVKRELVDGRTVPGARSLELSAEQCSAADWLLEYMTKPLRDKLCSVKLGAASSSAFDVPENASLFRQLIGELVGDFDLVIIDEAHKSRAGAEGVDRATKAADTVLQSRMSLCLNEILMRPRSASLRAKRVALTATPMEMDAKQWTSVLRRLGLAEKRVEMLKGVVTRFSDAVRQVRVGSHSEIEELESAAAAFQEALRPFVTRRLWRDHPKVLAFAKRVATGETAHPHRRMRQRTASLSGLSPAQKLQLAYTESVAMTSKGIVAEHVLKSAGSRYSQGLPLVSEQGKATAESVSEKPATSAAESDPAEQAKRLRQAYWLGCLGSLRREMGEVAGAARWSLQWHPRISEAISLIEELTGEGKKVLVFGEFIEPIRALDRALNIRHYLRHVIAGQPIPIPTGVRLMDPDVQRWLESPDLGFPVDRRQCFAKDAERLSNRYALDRAGLREACRAVTEQFFGEMKPRTLAMEPWLMDALIVWLVQSLCVGDQRSIYANSSNRAEIKAAVEQLLRGLADVDPAGGAIGDEADAERPFDWGAVIKEQLKELEQDESGNPVFRMSPFSQLLFGDTKPSTRRVRQHTFNNPDLNPQVLIGQSDVASEGLNLHRACRSVVLFHLDWNPGRIEQQIGRVDRQDSEWMRAFDAWNGEGEPPYIDIHTVAIEGTYDALRTSVVQERAKVLRSQLFGEVLPLEQLSALDEAARNAVERIKIDFRP